MGSITAHHPFANPRSSVLRIACIAALLVLLTGCTMSRGAARTGRSAQADIRPRAICWAKTDQ